MARWEAIEFYKTAFGATVDHTMLDPSGAKVMHSTLRFGEDRTAVFVSDVFREWGSIPSNVGITIYVPDPDAAFKRAVEAGATVKEPPSDSRNPHPTLILTPAAVAHRTLPRCRARPTD